MCLGAIYWSRPDKIYYACNKLDAVEIEFDVSIENRKMTLNQTLRDEALEVFNLCTKKNDKTEY